MKNKIKNFMFLAIAAILFASCSDDPANLQACFTFSPEEYIQVGDTVFFTNCSAEAESYNWNFGDGETSEEAEPFHIYAESGVYDIQLIANNGGVNVGVTKSINIDADLSYIINAGSWSGGKSTITAYNKYADEVTNGYYKAVNGVDLISNFQYAYNYDGNIFFMGNEVDEISWVDNKTFVQTENAISEDIVKPRYCVGKDNYLYVSCWGGNVWDDDTFSYIAKVNLSTKLVEKKIPLHGGPEGVEIVDNKLYAALNYKDSVAVMDLGTEAISYIQTPAVTSAFVKDNSNNLYVSYVGTYSDPSDVTGLAYINTSSDELVESYGFEVTGLQVSGSSVNILASNTDFSKIYVAASSPVMGNPGGIAVFDVVSKSFDSNLFLSEVQSMNGVGFFNNQVFSFISETVTGNGKVVVYSEEGTELNEYETGIAPFMLLKVE